MGKKRKRGPERPTIHPRNKYSDNPPDFSQLASLYPTFEPFVFYTRDGRPRIDWTDFNATRELTRVLLLHDHGLNWWIPEGQLCPTVPNRSNYIHWIEDLLSSDIIPKTSTDSGNVRGFDIGTGANCIYPLLGSSLLGWSFVGSDVTDVALEWAEKNVKGNPQISELIEIRRVESCQSSVKEENNGDSTGHEVEEAQQSSSAQSDLPSNANSIYQGPPILLAVVQDGEKFDFCMCNPPFFETMEEAGLNPKTSCGGTPAEMVCTGGEKAFITRIIEDSVTLKQTFRWYTAMVGRKLNLKILTSKLWEVGATVVKTTEFVQGQTCRWGLAWTFVPPSKKLVSPHVTEKKNLSFMLEGVQRQFTAIDVLHSIHSFFNSAGASCKLNSASFTIDITTSNNEVNNFSARHPEETSATSLVDPSRTLTFRISVFQQIPGTLLVKGSIHNKSPFPGLFSSIFQQLEADLISRFCSEKTSVTYSKKP